MFGQPLYFHLDECVLIGQLTLFLSHLLGIYRLVLDHVDDLALGGARLHRRGGVRMRQEGW